MHDSVFDTGSFAQSVIHHIPLLVHRVDAGETFDGYVAREYAVSLWEWLTEATQSIGGRVEEMR